LGDQRIIHRGWNRWHDWWCCEGTATHVSTCDLHKTPDASALHICSGAIMHYWCAAHSCFDLSIEPCGPNSHIDEFVELMDKHFSAVEFNV
jgi:hypothetical protein